MRIEAYNFFKQEWYYDNSDDISSPSIRELSLDISEVVINLPWFWSCWESVKDKLRMICLVELHLCWERVKADFNDFESAVRANSRPRAFSFHTGACSASNCLKLKKKENKKWLHTLQHDTKSNLRIELIELIKSWLPLSCEHYLYIFFHHEFLDHQKYIGSSYKKFEILYVYVMYKWNRKNKNNNNNNNNVMYIKF